MLVLEFDSHDTPRCAGQWQLPEQRTALGHGVFRASHSVAFSARILKDLMVIATREGLVAKEVHRAEVGQVLQAVRLIPALGEHIE